MDRPVPLLSICIPSYNRYAMVRELLAVLDGPDFLPFAYDVILVDNASEDSRYAEFASYRPNHHGFTYIRRPSTVGAFSNMTGALRTAAGTFCVFLADDDRLAAPFLASYVADMEAMPDIVATYAVFDEIDISTNQVTSRRPRFEPQLVDIDTVGPMIKAFRDGLYLPEIGIFRTEALVRSLLPHTAINPYALHFERIIRLGYIRFADEPFYQFVSGCDLEPYPRKTNSKSPTLAIFDASYRGIAIMHLRLALPRGGAPRQLAGLEQDYFMFTMQALDSAIGSGHALEACELALLGDGLFRQYSPGSSFSELVNMSDTVTLACYEAVALLSGDMPNINRLALCRLTPAQIDNFVGMASRIEASKSLPVDILEFDAIEEDASRIILTDTEASRAELIAQGRVRPGLAFSIEGLQAILQP